jgi:hypothetical protein
MEPPSVPYRGDRAYFRRPLRRSYSPGRHRPATAGDTECRADLEALVAKLYASGVRSVLRLLLRGEPLTEDIGVGDCVAEAGGGLTPAGFVEGVRDFDNPERCYLFRWGLGDVVTAVAGAG